MKIITGSTGTTHVTSNNDGEFNQGIFGDGFIVLSNGKQLNASIIDNNTIRIEDGDTIFQGRHALIEPNTTEDITIETGTIGMNRNDLIVERYVLDTSTGYEDCTLEVVKGDETSGAAVDPELTTGDIRTGDKLAEVALYRVKIEGVNIVALEKLFTVTDNLIDMIINLQEENSKLNSKIDSFDLSGYATKKEVSTAQSKADSAYSLANGKSNALTTAYLTADWSIGANELSKVVEFNVAKSGYTAIGIIGFDISDVGVVSVRGCDLSTGSVARIEITHVNETIYPHSGTASIRVLYVKN